MSLVGLLILLIIFGVVFWAVDAICAAFGIPNTIKTVVQVLLVLVCLLYLLQAFGANTGLPTLRLY